MIRQLNLNYKINKTYLKLCALLNLAHCVKTPCPQTFVSFICVDGWESYPNIQCVWVHDTQHWYGQRSCLQWVHRWYVIQVSLKNSCPILDFTSFCPTVTFSIFRSLFGFVCPKSNPPPLWKAVDTEYIDRNCLSIYTSKRLVQDSR